MTTYLRLFVIACVAAWTAGAAPRASAGVRIESQVVINAGKTLNNVLELQGKSFRINILDAASGNVLSSTIFDGEHIVKVEARTQTYTSMTVADLKAQLETLKASMSAENQAEIEKASVPPVFAFKRASGGDTIAGMPCDNYAMTRDGVDSGIACLASWKHANQVTKADLAPMTKLADELKASGRLPIGDIQMGPRFETWPGWPLVTHTPDGIERNRVTKVSRSTFPASDFVPPAGYTRKQPPQMPPSMGGGGAHP